MMLSCQVGLILSQWDVKVETSSEQRWEVEEKYESEQDVRQEEGKRG